MYSLSSGWEQTSVFASRGLLHTGGAFREQNNTGEGSLTSLEYGFVAFERLYLGHMLEMVPMVSFC